MLIRSLAALALVSAAAAPASAAQTGSFSVQYDGYAHGLIALKMSAELTLTPSAYSGELSYHTAGMVAWMVHSVSDSTVQGLFQNGNVAPQRFDSSGNLRGNDRVTHIVYRNGNPVIEQILPPPGQERTVIPTDQTLHTIDTLSAIAMLVRHVATTGSCDGHTMIFDGHRLTDLTATTVGQEKLPPSVKTHFNGQALRCDFAGNQLGGFMKNQDEAKLRQTKHGSAWLAPWCPAHPVPVRVVFEHPALGQVTLYLTQVSGGPGAVAALPVASRVQ